MSRQANLVERCHPTSIVSLYPHSEWQLAFVIIPVVTWFLFLKILKSVTSQTFGLTGREHFANTLFAYFRHFSSRPPTSKLAFVRLSKFLARFACRQRLFSRESFGIVLLFSYQCSCCLTFCSQQQLLYYTTFELFCQELFYFIFSFAFSTFFFCRISFSILSSKLSFVKKFFDFFIFLCCPYRSRRQLSYNII